MVAARPAASEERAAGLARLVALPRKTLLTMARWAEGPRATHYENRFPRRLWP